VALEIFLASVGFMANGVEFKAERRKPSGEKHCYTGIFHHSPECLRSSAYTH
jgi:hypothetical protein